MGGAKGQDNWVEKPDELANYLSGEDGWLCILRAGDELPDGALSAYGQAIATSPASTVIYSDDDLIDPSGCRSSPHFKPSWNSELFKHHDYITGSTVVKINRTDIRDVVDQSWARDLTRKAVQRSRPLHLPLVLHHLCRRSEPDLRATAAPLHDSPRAVSVIIPTRNQCSLLKVCVSGVRRLGYPGVEIVIVDNGSDDPETLAYLSELERAGVRVMRLPGPFNYSALNNAAVKEAKGDLFCFLNNDIEEIAPDWLRPLVAQAVREDVGAVGAQLLYPDGTIQHAGVVTGVGGGAGHAHRFQDPDDLGYFGRANLPQFVTAVTAACLVVERKKFEAVGGFDEIDFPVAFNDVDLCLKLNAHGWQSFYEPRSRLIHHESKSRGDDRAKSNRQRFAGELAALKRKWQTDLHCDPFHHPNLSPFTEQFYVAL